MYVSLNGIMYYILDAAVVVGRSELYLYYDLLSICIIVICNLRNVFIIMKKKSYVLLEKCLEIRFYN